MASADRTSIVLTRNQVLVWVLTQVAIEAAAESLRLGGYRPTDDAFLRVTRHVCESIRETAPAASRFGEFSDEELFEAASATGRNAVLAVLGPPAPESLN